MMVIGRGGRGDGESRFRLLIEMVVVKQMVMKEEAMVGGSDDGEDEMMMVVEMEIMVIWDTLSYL